MMKSVFRSMGLALACALALVAGSAYANSAPLKVQLVYVSADSAKSYAQESVAAHEAVHADVQALKALADRTCGRTLTVHEGFVSKSAGAVHSSSLAASGVLHAHHALAA